MPVVGIPSLHTRVSHKSAEKGSSISKRWTVYRLGITILFVMIGEEVEVEPAPVPFGDLGNGSATFELPAATYEKLRRLAAEYLRRERAGHTLQPTALLHEAFLRVLKQPDYSFRNETHIIAFAARAM